MTHRSAYSLIAAASICLFAVAWYFLTLPPHQQVRNSAEIKLLQIETFSHKLDRNLLRVRAGQTPDSAAIDSHRQSIQANVEQLEDILGAWHSHGQRGDNLADLFRDLKMVAEEKVDLAQKSLRSSVELTMAVDQFNALTETFLRAPGQISPVTLAELTAIMSRFRQEPRSDLAERLTSLLSNIHAPNAEPGADVATYIGLGERIIEAVPALDTTMQKALDLPIESKAHSLLFAVQAHADEHNEQSTLIRFAVYGFGLLVVIGVAVTFWNINRAKNRLTEQVSSQASDLRQQTVGRRHADEQRQIMEAQYSDIFENAVEGIVMTTPAGTFIRANPAYAHMMGYASPEELMSTISDISTEIWYDANERYEMLDRLNRDDRTRAEVRMKRKDGSIVWVSMAVWAGRSKDGELRYVNGILEDVTQRKALAERLAASEERYRQVADISSDWVWEMDSDLRFSYFSDSRRRRFGIAADVNIGKRREELTPLEELSKPHWQHHLADLQARRPFRDFGYEFVMPDGERRYMRISGTPIFDDDGQFDGYRGTSTDVTDLVVAERALEEARADLESQVAARTRELEDSRNQLRQVTDAFPALITHMTKDLRYAWVNKTCEEWYGLTRDDIVGKSVYEVHGRENFEVFQDVVDEVMTGKMVSEDKEVRYPDGKSRSVNVTYVPDLDEDGGVAGFFALSLDITEKHQTERLLIQSDKLATLGRMAAGIAHELSQPLNIIRLATTSSLIDWEDGERDWDQAVQTLAQIEGQVVRMAEIIEHMSIFARDDKSLDQEFCPGSAIRNALSLVRKQFESEGIALDTDVPDTCGLVRGAPVQLEQVVLNLVGNARDAINSQSDPASDARGTVSVSVADDPARGSVCIAVADNGGGIPDDKIGHVFDPFFTTKEVGSGTGLGLYIGYTIIQSMGGTIEVRNVDGGARFEITLPTTNDGHAADVAPA